MPEIFLMKKEELIWNESQGENMRMNFDHI